MRKWIPPDDCQGRALRMNLLFPADDHRRLLDNPFGVDPVAEAFFLASISFIAAMSRISARVKPLIVFCVILNISTSS